jgi:hypothetical protein
MYDPLRSEPRFQELLPKYNNFDLSPRLHDSPIP